MEYMTPQNNENIDGYALTKSLLKAMVRNSRTMPQKDKEIAEILIDLGVEFFKYANTKPRH